MKKFFLCTVRKLIIAGVLLGTIAIPIQSASATNPYEWKKVAKAYERQVWSGLASSSDGMRLVALRKTTSSSVYDINTSIDGGASWTRTNLPAGYWSSVASSSDGMILVVAGTISINRSTDGGATWTRTTAMGGDWQHVASSSDGMRLVAIQQGGNIYTSSDGGETWRITSAPRVSWQSVASSKDGMRLVAAVNSLTVTYGVYISTDGGSTWTPTSAPVASWQSVASSSDGMRLVAAGITDGVFTSSDGAASWDGDVIGYAWRGVASSSDGKYLAAVQGGSNPPDLNPQPGYIYTSRDYGESWTRTSAPLRSYYGVVVSDDGMRIVAANSGPNTTMGAYVSIDAGQTWQFKIVDSTSTGILAIAASKDARTLITVPNVVLRSVAISRDGGLTWTQTTSQRSGNWRSVASSSDGMRLVAVQNPGGIYISDDGGLTWRQTSAPRTNWQSIASSSDGMRLVAVQNPGGIYISDDGGSTWTPTNASIASWQSVASSSDGVNLVAASTTGMYTSTDGGTTWTLVISDLNLANMRSVTMSADGTQILAGGPNGLVMRALKASPAAPSANPVTTTSATITGTGTPGDTIWLTLKGSKRFATLVAADGAWVFRIPEGITLDAGEEIILEAESADSGLVSESARLVVGSESLADTGTDAPGFTLAGLALAAAAIIHLRMKHLRCAQIYHAGIKK